MPEVDTISHTGETIESNIKRNICFMTYDEKDGWFLQFMPRPGQTTYDKFRVSNTAFEYLQSKGYIRNGENEQPKSET